MTSPAQFGPALLGRRLHAALIDVESSKAHIRRAAAADLSRHLDSDSRVSIVERLERLTIEDPDVEVRVAAILALADAGANESVGLMVKMARSDIPRVRQIALLALGELAEPGQAQAIDAALDALDSELPALRYQGLVTLKSLRNAEAIEAIVSKLADPDPEVRWVAVRLIEELILARSASSANTTHLEPGENAIIANLRPLMKDPIPRVAVAATLLLTRMGDAAAIDNLAPLLTRKTWKLDHEDELAVIDLVGQLGLVRAKPDLERRAWPLLWEGSLAWSARVALAQLGDERARRAVLQNLHSNSPLKCARAIEAVGRIGLEGARPRLHTLLANASEYDVEAIESALLRLGPAQKPGAR